jgi:hypothetical protein
VRNTPATTPVKLAAALLLAAGGLARAQEPPPLPPLPPVPAALRPSAPEPRPAGVQKLHYHQLASPALPAAADEILQVQATQPLRPVAGPGSDQLDYVIQLLPPSRDRMFRIMNEDALREQIRQEGREAVPKQATVFPDERRVTDEPYAPREFPSQVALVEASYVNYKRLYFQDVNSERYGWELGFAQPALSAGRFFVDLGLVPYRFASRPFDCIESSAGYCLPDSPVPYLIYPPELSVTGAMGEAAAILGLIAVFP